jgi:nucleoside-diphosphate-sugar epimerase
MKSDIKQHVLILGVTGFIGSAFFNALKVNSEHLHFHLLLRKENDSFKASENCSIYYSDLESFDWSLLEFAPNFVYHFARINSTKWRFIGRLLAALKGKRANVKLLNYLNDFAPLCTLYYLSGSLMYGNGEKLITEGQAINPISFARGYQTAEKPFLKNQKLEKSINTCVVRVPWVLGDGSWFKGFYKNYLIKNKLVPFYGDGSNIMSFITLVDLADELGLLMKSDFHKTIHISYSTYMSQLEFVKLVATFRRLDITQISVDQYEKAIKEAFTSNIMLSSKIKELKVSSEELKQKLNSQLALIFKDV